MLSKQDEAQVEDQKINGIISGCEIGCEYEIKSQYLITRETGYLI